MINYSNNISTNASREIIDAINIASESSGVEFSYLVNQAAAESNFDPDAKAKTSSATGLYQFIDSTWMSMIDRYGSDYGLDTDGKTKEEILEMRKDPKASSFMAAAFASENEKFLNTNWGGEVGSTELYFAHFMGASGAASFLNAKDENPLQPAADLFPRAAKTNRNVFYDSNTGEPRSLQEVYNFFDDKFNPETNNSYETEIANNAPTPPNIPERKMAENSFTNDNYNSNNTTNSLYTPSRKLSDSVIMRRAQAMREAAETGNNYANSLNNYSTQNQFVNNNATNKPSVFKKSTSSNQDPLLGLIAKPFDLMMLTQASAPSKVIDDNV